MNRNGRYRMRYGESNYTRVELQECPGSTEEEHPDLTEQETEEEEGEVQAKKDRWTRRKRNTDLILAVLDSDLPQVKSLLGPASGVSPMVRCQQSMATVSHLAALRGEEEILQELMKSCKASTGSARPVLEARDARGRQPHHLAAAAGQLGTLTLILEEEPELIDSQAEITALNTREEDYDSFLHDHFEVTNLLITVAQGSTALHIAAKYSYLSIVDFLLMRGADVNIKDREGLSPLDVAGVYADPSVPGTIVSAAVPATFALETDSPFEDSGPSDIVMTPFSLEPSSISPPQSFPSSQPKHFRLDAPPPREGRGVAQPANTTVSVVSKLLKGGGRFGGDSICARTTPIHRFVERADIKAIKDFLREEPDGLEAKDGQGRTPIHFAVELNLIDLLKLMLSSMQPSRRTIAVNAIDNKGRTPLHIAVQYEYAKIIEILLEEHTDLKVQTTDGENILHIAARKKNPEIITTLLERTSRRIGRQTDVNGYTPLARAVETGDARCVELFLDFGSPIRIIQGSRDTLIHIAVRSRAVNVLRLLSMRSNFNYDRLNAAGYGPVHLAARENSLECLRLLLDLNRVDLKIHRDTLERGTALHIAAERGHVNAVETILNKLNDEGQLSLVKERDAQGREALILAALGGHAECLTLLLKYGANLAARDVVNPQLTALDLMYYNTPNAVRLVDDLMTGFMTVIGEEKREDSPDFEVGLDFKCFLADSSERSPRQLGVVEAFIKCKDERLRKSIFLHPLTESFLQFKWKQLELFFRILVAIFAIHLSALTAYSLCTHVYQDIFISKYAEFCRVIVWISIVPLFVFEVMTFRRDKTYLLDSEAWVKWSVLVSSAASVMPGNSEAMRILSSLAVLLAWLQILFLVARGQVWGLRVLMFLEVAANVMQVLSTFFFLPLGFAFSFLILFNKKHPFEGLGETMSKVLVMMVELDYAGVYGNDTPQPGTEVNKEFEVVGRLVYLGFVVLVVMVLNNLILGMSTADVQEIENQGRSQRVMKQASFLVLFEKLCYESRLPRYAIDVIGSHMPADVYTTVYPNRKKDAESNPLPREIRNRILHTVAKNSLRELDNELIEHRIDSLAEEIHSLTKAVERLKEISLRR